MKTSSYLSIPVSWMTLRKLEDNDETTVRYSQFHACLYILQNVYYVPLCYQFAEPGRGLLVEAYSNQDIDGRWLDVSRYFGSWFTLVPDRFGMFIRPNDSPRFIERNKSEILVVSKYTDQIDQLVQLVTEIGVDMLQLYAFCHLRYKQSVSQGDLRHEIYKRFSHWNMNPVDLNTVLSKVARSI